MQELSFEQVEHVSGGLMSGPFIVNDFTLQNQQNGNNTSTYICTAIDGAIGGIIGKFIGSLIKLSSIGASAGTGAGIAFLTPCANTTLACIEDSSKCPTAPEDYQGGPQQPDPLL